jgi:hypothetical protein
MQGRGLCKRRQALRTGLPTSPRGRGEKCLITRHGWGKYSTVVPEMFSQDTDRPVFLTLNFPMVDRNALENAALCRVMHHRNTLSNYLA